MPFWLLRKDSNLERRNQNPPCYRLHHGEITLNRSAPLSGDMMWAGAEALGFEPKWRLPTPNGFQDRRNRPLCQTSISTRTGASCQSDALRTIIALSRGPINRAISKPTFVVHTRDGRCCATRERNLSAWERPLRFCAQRRRHWARRRIDDATGFLPAAFTRRSENLSLTRLVFCLRYLATRT